jgi:hypothetical protein
MRERNTDPASTSPSTGTARVRQVRPGGWQPYRERALETIHAVQRSAEAREWSAVIAIAPVSVLAAAQAVVAQRANVTSRPDDYNTAVELLRIHGAGLPNLEAAMEWLRHLLQRKVTIQHGAEPASEPAAMEVLHYAVRFVEWADQQLTTSPGDIRRPT